MTPKIANRLKNIKPSPTLALTQVANDLRAKGRDIIALNVGEPDFDTPEHVKEGGREAINKGQTKYTPVPGTNALREAIVQKFKTDNHIDYKVSEVVAGVGGKQILFNAIMATVNPGDEVIIPAPYWVSYPDMVELAEGKPVFVKTSAQNKFRMTAKELESAITPKTKWLILNSPSNPTGSAYTKAELRQIADVLLRHPHVMIMSDDIYEYLVYDDFEFATLVEVEPTLKDRTLIVNGVSKSYSMTGWRIGYGAGPEWLIKAMIDLQSHSTSNASSIAQAAALAGLKGSKDFLTDWRKSFVERRNRVVDLLNQIDGIVCEKPEGAFYVYPSCAGLIGRTTPDGKVLNTDADVCRYFIESVGVVVVHGEAFGLSPYFRVSYASDMKTLEDACKRIADACAKLQKKAA